MSPDQHLKDRIQVEAYAGASYPERPTAVWWQGQRLDVTQVLRSWRTPDGLHFLVEIAEIGRAELIYQDEDGWRMEVGSPHLHGRIGLSNDTGGHSRYESVTLT
jgi:hypothetical protein